MHTAAALPLPFAPRAADRPARAHAAGSRRDAGLPPLKAFAADLQTVTQVQRIAAPLLPLLTLAAFVALCTLRLYALLPLATVAHFIAITAFTHDVAHGTAGLGRKASDWVLFVVSIAMLESGHAFRYSHLHHHSHCMEEDDLEGAPALGTLAEALLGGPGYLARLGLAAYRRSPSRRERRWMLAELAGCIAMVFIALLLVRVSAIPLAYLAMMWLGSWLYPVTTAWLPHYRPAAHALGQSRTLRGRIVPALFLNLTYHLEHHLYPQVPGANLHLLAERLDPYFAERGVRPVQAF
ncbi:MAG: fatty acid desaturase family protein [Gammaproteobacteria bacterium]